MSELPVSLGQRADNAPIRLVPADAVRLEHILFQQQYGIAVATSVGDATHGFYALEFEFDSDAEYYEVWIEYAAEVSRPVRVKLDGRVWFEAAAGVTGGWAESEQVWHYEATIALPPGAHRLELNRVGYLPHIRAIAFLPVGVPAHGPIGAPTERYRPFRPPERTLICIIAQTRAHQLTWTNFKRNVLDELHADMAVAIGADANYDYANPYWQHAQYRWTAPEYEDYGDGLDEAQSWLASEAGVVPQPWRQVMRQDGNWLGAIKGPLARGGGGGPCLYFRWFLRQKLIQNGLLERYDRFIITRSDYLWVCPHPPLSILSPDGIWIPNGESHGGVTDRHMIVSRADLSSALGLIEDVVLRPDDLLERLAGLERADLNLETYLYFHLRERGLLNRTRLFPYVMFLVRGEHEFSRWSGGVFNEEVGAWVKYEKEYEIAREWRDKLTGRRDWERAFEDYPELFPPRI